jgi:hypothetical protein
MYCWSRFLKNIWLSSSICCLKSLVLYSHIFLGEERYSCLHCDRVFAQQRSLKIHLATHRRKSLSRLPVTCEENASTTARPVVPVARPVVHSPEQHVRSSTRLRLKKRRVYSLSPDITGSESEYEEEETTVVEKRGKENRNKNKDSQPRSVGVNVEAKERLEYQEAGNACSGETPGERTEEMDAKRGTLSRKRSPGEGHVEKKYLKKIFKRCLLTLLSDCPA